ncbi:MAG: hypothetical protein M1835_003620 [Candelina submexicana]|nr:MAG: hypothetical protein M1835_003620 [Candelina submexicana]
MPRVRPNLSITLPRNFTFHYTDGGPKTPENQEREEPRQPSPPVYRIRRRIRPGLGLSNPHVQSYRNRQHQDVPIPTIETPQPVVESASLGRRSVPEPGPVEGLLAPVPSHYSAMATPRTPLAQIFTAFGSSDKDRIDWSQKGEPNPGDSISRPNSACSMISDSSVASHDSDYSLLSTGGSCTSPESDVPAPFKFPSESKVQQGTDLDTTPKTTQPSTRSKPTKPQKSTQWTSEMDRHLWATYQLYLQDPTVTPFKSLPGNPPPLGVCHRVARVAKRSWRGSKPSLAKGPEVLRDVNDEANAVHNADSPQTIRGARSGSTTPTEQKHRNSFSVWPRSESATRRRLRILCKRKPSLAPHYQRLMQTRSSTPFSKSSAARSRSSLLPSSFGGYQGGQSFNTRDLNFSLATSTAATMQPSGPLAHLTRNEPHTQAQSEQADSFNRPLHDVVTYNDTPSLGLGIDGLDDKSRGPRLGSPFVESVRGTANFLHRAHLRPSPPRTQSDGMTIPGPHLGSPVQLPEPFRLPSTPKRRAQRELDDELSPGGSDMHPNEMNDDYFFTAPVESSHRRVRSRGFSLGDISAGGRLSDLFTPPTQYDQMNSSEFADNASFDNNPAPSAAPEQTRRLGSPFSEFKSYTIGRSRFSRHKPSFSTFPRLSSPPLLTAPSIEERLRESKPEDQSQESPKE